MGTADWQLLNCPHTCLCMISSENWLPSCGEWAAYGEQQYICDNGVMSKDSDGYIIRPNPQDQRLIGRVTGVGQTVQRSTSRWRSSAR